MRNALLLLALTLLTLRAEDTAYDGLDTRLSNPARTSDAKSRSICPENPTGEKGNAAKATEGMGQNAARELGQGWKISPCFKVKAHSTLTMADIDGSGQIQQIWMTPAPLDKTRWYIIRMYWDG